MLPSSRRRFVVPAAIVIALAVAPALTACGNPLQNIVQEATGGKLDIGGTQVPADFPSDVPLIQGDVIFGAGIGNDDGKVWTVTVKVSGAEASQQISDQLTSAGFSSEGDLAASGDTKTEIFTKEHYGVLVVVSKDDKDGFIASYTVTYTKDQS